MRRSQLAICVVAALGVSGTVESTPANANPTEPESEAKPAEAKPDAKPAEAKPDAKPAEEKPGAKPAEAKPDAKPAEPPDATPAASTPSAAASMSGIRTPTAPPNARIDLFPPSVFGQGAPAASASQQSAVGAEKRSSLLLGDDGNWKVQAAQVGAMVAGFAALAALCSGGGCMLPDSLSLPGPLKAKPPGIRYRPKPQPIPDLR